MYNEGFEDTLQNQSQMKVLDISCHLLSFKFFNGLLSQYLLIILQHKDKQ